MSPDTEVGTLVAGRGQPAPGGAAIQEQVERNLRGWVLKACAVGVSFSGEA